MRDPAETTPNRRIFARGRAGAAGARTRPTVTVSLCVGSVSGRDAVRDALCSPTRPICASARRCPPSPARTVALGDVCGLGRPPARAGALAAEHADALRRSSRRRRSWPRVGKRRPTCAGSMGHLSARGRPGYALAGPVGSGWRSAAVVGRLHSRCGGSDHRQLRPPPGPPCCASTSIARTWSVPWPGSSHSLPTALARAGHAADQGRRRATAARPHAHLRHHGHGAFGGCGGR